MYDNTVFQIIEDNQKSFWLTCNRGIYRVSKKELNDYANGKIQTVHCAVFGTADGLRSTKCNGSCQPAGIRANDGKLWIPTMKGVAIIDPAKLTINKTPSPVFIEHAFFDKHAVQIDSNLQMGPGQGDLELHYIALSYAAPKLLRFKYILVAFDKDWINADTRRVAYYTNISPGKHTFKVTACNKNGVWNETGASFAFILQPHFYESWWFYGLVTLIVVGAGFGMYRLRVWQLLARERELTIRINEATAKIKTLDGLIPICANCKKIRDDKGYWDQLEGYIQSHTEAKFSHGVCPECAEKLYGKYYAQVKNRREDIALQVPPPNLSKE